MTTRNRPVMSKPGPKKVLIVGAGFLQSFAIRKAHQMGLFVIGVDRDPKAVGFEWCDRAEIVDIKDERACLEVARRERVDGVLSVSTDFAVKTVAFVAETLGLPALSTSAARMATNKVLMRGALTQAGVGCPRFGEARSVDEGLSVSGAVGFPCILKPVDSVGSRGVTKVESSRGMVPAFEAASAASASGSVILEEYVDGPEISVEAITARGKTRIAAVTDKITTGPPHFVELGHTQPSVFAGNDAVVETVEACVRALGIDFSASHAEMRMTGSGPVVMEVGARLGGDRITSDLVPLSCGIDLMDAVVRVALGEFPDIVPLWQRGSAIRYLNTGPGTVLSVTGVEGARSVEGVTDVRVEVNVGDRVPELRSSSDRVGHVVANGTSAGEAGRIAERALSLIRIEVVQ